MAGAIWERRSLVVEGFRFAEPNWLWVIPLVLVVTSLLYLAKERAWRGAIVALCAPHLREWNVRLSLPRERLRALCGVMALCLVLVALARPQLGWREVEVTSPASAVLFLLDVSRSMLVSDVTPNRLTRAKLLAQDLLQEMERVEVGLAVFAGEAALLVPPTREHALVAEFLREANPNSVPRGGTNFENALHEAVAILGGLPHHEKTVVLLTDGEDLEGDVGRVAGAFREYGMRLYAAVFGTEEGSTIVVEDERGRGSEFIRDPSGRVVISRARPREMADLAGSLGGSLLTEAALPEAQESETREIGAVRAVANEWLWLPAAGAFLFAFLHVVLPARKSPRAFHSGRVARGRSPSQPAVQSLSHDRAHGS